MCPEGISGATESGPSTGQEVFFCDQHLCIMKTIQNFTYRRAILFGMLTEVFLIALQYVYLAISTSVNPEVPAVFNTEYMMTRGFYVFQIIGFFVYVVSVYLINMRYAVKGLNFLLAYVITGGIMELLFYVAIQADYQGAFLYSILDKFVAAVFGAIVYFYTTGKESAA
jgi:hypothetical protein